MKNTVLVAVAIVLVGAGLGFLSLETVNAQAAPQPAGNGNTPSVNVTADGPTGDGLVGFSFWCRNAHKDDIWDIVCALPNLPAGAYGITELNVDDDDDGDNDDEWDVDDNANGTLDEGENDATDSTPGKSTRSINTKASHAIKKDKNFRVNGVVKLPKDQDVYTILLMPTNKKKEFQEDPPNYVGGGTMEDPVHTVTSGSGLITTAPNAAFEMVVIGIYGENADAAGAETVLVNPPTGAVISSVQTVGDLNPGVWNPTTRTFTFATPVANGQLFGLNVIFSDVPGEFTWQVGY